MQQQERDFLERRMLGEIFNGVETRVYDIPALEAGTHPFICTVHPNMTGTITAE